MARRMTPPPYLAPPPPPVRSRVMRLVAAWSAQDARAVRWADRNPVAWEIVTTDRSRALGLGSGEYPERTRSACDSAAVRDRVVRLHELVLEARRRGGSSLYAWRAAFAMRHFRDPGFASGLLQQWTGRTERFRLWMDHTPSTLNEAIDRFAAWRHHGWPVTRVTLDGRTVRESASPSNNKTMRFGHGIR